MFFIFKAACCQLHIAALMAEYLKLRKVHPWGAEAFDQISVNISKDERNLKLDAGEICMFVLLHFVYCLCLLRFYRVTCTCKLRIYAIDIGLVSGIQDIHYNESLLLEQLEVCADMLEKAERFELLGHLYRLIVPMYEKGRNYEALANCYSHLAQACNKIVEVTRTGKRLLGRFYRVAFFGMVRLSAERAHFSNLKKIQDIHNTYIYLYIYKFMLY